MRLPRLLQDPSDDPARDVLHRYYGTGRHRGANPFTGARFDTWDSTGNRSSDHDRFTADDLVAVTMLSVDVTAGAAIELLDTKAAVFSQLLEDLGPDRDLALEKEAWSDDWEGWLLWRALIALPGVGPTTASKLLARKRPRLRPIYDSVVVKVTGSDQLWEPMRSLLSEDLSLHERLTTIRDDVGLPEEVSALRVFDVLAWMEGKGNITFAEALEG